MVVAVGTRGGGGFGCRVALIEQRAAQGGLMGVVAKLGNAGLVLLARLYEWMQETTTPFFQVEVLAQQGRNLGSGSDR